MNFPQPNGFGNMPQMPYNNPYQMTPSQNPRTQNNGINWIQGGDDEAKSYPLTPNSNVALIDGNQNVLYLKSCDSMGMCTLLDFDIVERKKDKTTAVSVSAPDMSAYVRREEFDELKQLIDNIGGRIDEKFVSNNGQSGKQHNSNSNNYNGKN